MDNMRYDMGRMKLLNEVEKVLEKYNIDCKLELGEVETNLRGVPRAVLYRVSDDKRKSWDYRLDKDVKEYEKIPLLRINFLSSGDKYSRASYYEQDESYFKLNERRILEELERTYRQDKDSIQAFSFDGKHSENINECHTISREYSQDIGTYRLDINNVLTFKIEDLDVNLDYFIDNVKKYVDSLKNSNSHKNYLKITEALRNMSND